MAAGIGTSGLVAVLAFLSGDAHRFKLLLASRWLQRSAEILESSTRSWKGALG
jgi:hypothetical protein